MLFHACGTGKASPGGEGQNGDTNLQSTGPGQQSGAAPEGGAGGADVVQEENGASHHLPAGCRPQEVVGPMAVVG